ncbi:MAG: hypothetical protein KGL53_10165, partial [Elusimicrobia bacterium]|nr:hypothetical protein [Elusimicrobiota bacterium]
MAPALALALLCAAGAAAQPAAPAAPSVPEAEAALSSATRAYNEAVQRYNAYVLLNHTTVGDEADRLRYVMELTRRDAWLAGQTFRTAREAAPKEPPPIESSPLRPPPQPPAGASPYDAYPRAR